MRFQSVSPCLMKRTCVVIRCVKFRKMRPKTTGAVTKLGGRPGDFSGTYLQPERDRPVVDQRHLHVRAELTRLNNGMRGTRLRNEVIKQPAAFLRRRSRCEAWPQPA